jgi:hypothetical protein
VVLPHLHRVEKTLVHAGRNILPQQWSIIFFSIFICVIIIIIIVTSVQSFKQLSHNVASCRWRLPRLARRRTTATAADLGTGTLGVGLALQVTSCAIAG